MHIRSLSCVLALLSLALLAGCGEQDQQPVKPQASTPATEALAGSPTPEEVSAARDRLHEELMADIGKNLRERRLKIVRVHMITFETAIDTFRLINNRLPSSLEELTKTPEGRLQPYIDAIEPDPWKNPYAYRLLDPTRFEIRSHGRDGEAGTDDDVVWPEGTAGR